MKRYYTLLLIICLLFSMGAFAQTAKVGLVGAQFLKIDVGARGMALGDAVLPLVDDASASFWNPANLSLVKRGSVFASNVSWIADVQYNAAAAAWNFGSIGVVGAFFSHMNSGEIEETTFDQQQGTGNTFTSTGTVFGLSYAKWLTTQFSFGVNAKYVSENLVAGLAGMPSDYAQGGAWAVDLGTFYNTGIKSVRFGIMIKNFGAEIQPSGSYTDWELGDTILTEVQVPDPDDPTSYMIVEVPEERDFRPYHMPLSFQFGIAFDPINTEMHKLSLAMVITQPNDNVQRFNVAAEYWFMDILALRAGYSLGQYDELTGFEDDGTAIYEPSFQGQDLRRLSYGAGVNWKGIRLNVAMTMYDILDPVTNLSVAFNF